MATVDVTQHLETITKKIDDGIDQYAPPAMKEQLKSIESMHPMLKQAHVVGGALLLPVLILFYVLGGFTLLVSLSGFLYPAYKSLQAMEVNDPAEDKQWLTYWVVYGTFSIFESVMSFLKDIIPYYNVLKLGLFIFLYHSSTKGATKVYDKILTPYIIPHISGAKATKAE
eukprot:CAMPEP_0181260544 /NCGR_PEP_ID=MMETSP1097-20121128/1000_1 /TAXON_ID=35684 /ORGANISM="Pseudopedinella elastica, Strain CCMP716" /LENGTH=169 /DNA_ID=CAMNT_0023359065 /DNA_START=28 /DNA_END=537 /DNA_ORIENTATION=-